MMLYSTYDLETLMAYKTSQYLQEAEHARLVRQALSRPASSLYDQFLASLGRLLVSVGSELQRRANECLPLEESAQPAR